MNNKDFILPPSLLSERKKLFLETLINTTDKVTKVSPNSVNSGIASGIARLSGLVEKDIAAYFSKLHPDYSHGQELDKTASLFGIPSRLTSTPSSTYLLIIAEENTVYLSDTNFFQSEDGITFKLDQDETIGPQGFIYARATSIEVGVDTNVNPLSILQVSPEPTGHISVLNEVGSVGGSDLETDELFRRRVKEGINSLSTNTLSMLHQKLLKVNNNILRLLHQGVSDTGKTVIGVVTQNGSLLESQQLSELSSVLRENLCLTDFRREGLNYSGIELRNIDFYPIDISMRVQFDGTVDFLQLRVNLQTKISKYLDWRTWDSLRQKVEWDNLLEIVKSTKGIKYVQDQFFQPRVDIKIDVNQLPRLRSFSLLDLNGKVVTETDSQSFSPIFYQNFIDRTLQPIL